MGIVGFGSFYKKGKTMLIWARCLPWAALLAVFVVSLGNVQAQEKKNIPSRSDCNLVCVKIQEIERRSKFMVFVLAERHDGKIVSTGSGFLTRDESVWHILTNSHVVSGSSVAKLWVALHGIPGFQETRVIGNDPGADVALLEAPDIPRGVEAAELGERLEMGQQIYAVGYPFGIFDISTGYVNALESSLWLYVWSQVPINPGSSGGPVLNETLQVVGISTAILTGNVTPKSLILPVEYLRKLLPRLKTEQMVKHGLLDAGLKDASRIPPSFFQKWGIPYRPRERKVFVVESSPESQAAKAGLQPGDAIVGLNNAPVGSARELSRKIFFDYRPGQKVSFTIERGGQMLERRLTLGEFTNPFISADEKKGKE